MTDHFDAIAAGARAMKGTGTAKAAE